MAAEELIPPGEENAVNAEASQSPADGPSGIVDDAAPAEPDTAGLDVQDRDREGGSAVSPVSGAAENSTSHDEDADAAGPAVFVPDAEGATAGSLDPLVGELAALRTSFHQRAVAHEDTIRSLQATIGAMQATIDSLQSQQLASTMKPVFRQFVDLHGELSDGGMKARSAGASEHADDLDFYAQRVEDILDNFDLESVNATVGAAFDRRAHAAVMARPTTDADADQTIARVVRQGFRIIGEERVLIPARVVVWKYSPESTTDPSPEEAPVGAPGTNGAPTDPPLVDTPRTRLPDSSQ